MYQITEYKPGNEQEIYNLVKKVYDEFVSHENSNEGNQLFYEWIKPEKIANRQATQNNIWLAWIGQKIIGMIEIRDINNITLLFVDKSCQGQGVASRLFQIAIAKCVDRAPGLDKFYVHASMCSVPVYKSFGFCVAGKAQKENGIFYVPMEMEIKKEGKNKNPN